MTTRTKGDMRVWWIPQLGGPGFEFDVSSVEEAAKFMTVLANYDLFQFENRIKPDYSNAGGLLVWNGAEWIDWEDEETGESDPVEYLRQKQGTLLPLSS